MLFFNIWNLVVCHCDELECFFFGAYLEELGLGGRNLKDFRLVSLGSSIYKFLAKVLANKRLWER